MKPIRLCIVMDHFPACNGAFFQAVLLAREIQKHGGEVIFVSYLLRGKTGPLCSFEARRLDVDDLNTITIDSNVSNKWKAVWLYIRLFFRLRNQYNLVLVQGLPTGIFWILPAWKILGKKVFIRLTGLNINDPAAIRESPYGFFKNIVLQLANRHITPSLAMEKVYRKSSLIPSKSIRIPNGVDTKRFHPLGKDEREELRKRLGYSPLDRIVLYVGTIRRAKGTDFLLEAWDRVLADVPQALLVLIGPLCPLCPDLKAADQAFIDKIRPKIGFFIQEKKVLLLQNRKNRIQFLGVVDRVERYYQVAELFAFPSRREGMPNVVMEAMASGVPVVANNIEEITGELIQNNREGTIVSGNSTQEFADAIINLLTHPHQQRQIAKTARRKMEEDFSPLSLLKRYNKLFEH